MRATADPLVHAWDLHGLTVEHYRYDPGDAGAVESHAHQSHQICVSPDTPGEYTLGRRRFAVPAQSVSFVPAGEKHAARDLEPRRRASTFWMIYVQPERWSRLSAADNRDQTPRIHADERFRAAASLPVRLAASTSRLEQDTHLACLKDVLFGEGAIPVTIDSDRLARVRDFLENSWTENPSLESLAAMSHLSPWHLNRAFRQRYRVPPHAYLMQVRLRAAKRMIIEGRPLSEAAHAAGFSDQSHLNRMFRRSTGTTPTRYRRGSKIVQDPAPQDALP